jgi:hypothetical protein
MPFTHPKIPAGGTFSGLEGFKEPALFLSPAPPPTPGARDAMPRYNRTAGSVAPSGLREETWFTAWAIRASCRSLHAGLVLDGMGKPCSVRLAAVLLLVSIKNRKGSLAILLHHPCHLPPSFGFPLGESPIGFSSPAEGCAIEPA